MKTIYLMAAMAILGCAVSCTTSPVEEPIQTAAVTAPHTTNELFVADSSIAVGDAAMEPVLEEEQAPDNQALQKSKGNTEKSNIVYPDWNKKLIKTADLQLEVKQYEGFDKQMRQALQQYGAYIANETQSSSSGRIQHALTIKVPVAYFDDLVEQLTQIDSIRVENKLIKASDVSTDMVDTYSRMQSRKKVRERYLQLLQQAHKMDDILQVEQQVNSIQEEIESAAGRLNYLKHQTTYSTIELRYYAYVNVPIPTIEPDGFFTKAWHGFRTGGIVIVEIILFMIRIWPLILGGIIAVVLWRKRRNITNPIE